VHIGKEWIVNSTLVPIVHYITISVVKSVTRGMRMTNREQFYSPNDPTAQYDSMEDIKRAGVITALSHPNFDAEMACRIFARQFPTPHVKYTIALAESGKVEWKDLLSLFQYALSDGLEKVRNE